MTQPTDAELDRRNDRQIARMNLAGTGIMGFVTAVVAAGAAILGVWLGNSNARDTVSKQIASQAAEDHANFISQQEESAYATALSGMLFFRSAVTDLTLNAVGGTLKANDSQLTGELNADEAKLMDAFGSVDLVGSTPVQKDGGGVRSAAFALLEDSVSLLSINRAGTYAKYGAGAVKKITDDLVPWDNAVTQFSDDARSDIQH